VKSKAIYVTLTLLALSAPAVAQGFEPGTMPPREIMRMLRATGFEPMSRPMRRGPNYVVFAVDNRDREVRIVIGARTGGIVSVAPMQTASQGPPRGGVNMGPYERMPPGYAPPAGYRSGPPTAEDDDGPPPAGYGMRPPAPIPGALPRSSNAVPPPDRGSPLPDADDDAGPSSGPNVIPADRDRNAGLPPPPERFPQRVAPPAPAKPKPVKRAAAGPPKQAPLPKPKPGAAPEAKSELKPDTNVEAPSPQTPPTAWPDSKSDDAALPN
jgi:hypothetical protein